MARLPKRYVRFFERFPTVGTAYEAYGEAVAAAGPLDEKTRCLVKLAMSISARMEGGAKSHAHKALEAGASPEEIRHVALLAAPTIGFPNMMAGLSWVDEILDGIES
ncbi:MAG: carboxymuconolactone decarboxylase family protein [Armatimonadetes bacterium]|nr:carboxymuconolactone decarboxylase family protein [Armatimonadota bacterium]